jgi:hypothetical protein
MTPAMAMLYAAARGADRPKTNARRRGSAPAGPGAAASPLPPYARRAAITAYAAAGLSREEIVRRTRLSYDAVAVLVPERRSPAGRRA